MIISLCATIYLNTLSTETSNAQTEILKIIPEDAPVLPEVQVVKTILKKVIEL